MRLYDNDSYRDEFMNGVYALLNSDPTNDRANQIISLFDGAPEVDAEPVRHGRWRGLDCTHYAGTDEYGEPAYRPRKEYKCSLRTGNRYPRKLLPEMWKQDGRK